MNAANERPAMPQSLAEWKLCAKDLEAKQQGNRAARQRVAEQREAVSLRAMRGDAAARRKLAELAGEAATLSREAEALEAGMRSSALAIAEAERAEAERARVAKLERYATLLSERLELVGRIEQFLIGLSPMLDALDDKSQQVEGFYQQLGGSPQLMAPLSRENIGGRLAEFIAGTGLGAWLPLAKPEIRPAISSLVDAEEAAQRRYRLEA